MLAASAIWPPTLIQANVVVALALACMYAVEPGARPAISKRTIARPLPPEADGAEADGAEADDAEADGAEVGAAEVGAAEAYPVGFGLAEDGPRSPSGVRSSSALSGVGPSPLVGSSGTVAP